MSECVPSTAAPEETMLAPDAAAQAALASHVEEATEAGEIAL